MRDDMTREQGTLPPGWAWTTLGEACAITMGQSPPSDTYNTDRIGLPFYQGKAEFGDLYPTPVKWCSQPGKTAEAGDVLVSIRAPVGPTNLCRETSCIGRGLAALRPQAGMASLYFLYLLRHIEQELAEQATGTTFSAISGNVLRNQEIPLAPLPEQRRIVAEIEKQFTRLDAGVAALKRVQAKLKRYRASVLRAACEGRLAPQDPADESADRLLARILTERRAKWEVAHPGKKYVEPAAAVTDGLPGLPVGWCWASIEQACDRIVDCLHSTPVFRDGRRLCVDSNCIEPGRIVLERARYVDESTFEERNRRMIPLEDDVVFSREGALLGIAVRVPANLPFCLGQRMMIFRPSAAMLGRLFENILNSSVFRSQYRALITGTASPHLNIGDIRLRAVPLPPLPEQYRIVTEVERRLSVVAAVEAAVAVNLARAGRLRQAVLKRAFEGRLVGQAAGDA